jgi:hypothetical protein
MNHHGHTAEIAPDMLAMLASTAIPEVTWDVGDDLCDCTFQRIGFWTNPYLARTLRVRFCCIWDEIFKEYPEHVQEIPAFVNYNQGEDVYVVEPLAWDASHDMPRALWYRQKSSEMGLPIGIIRDMFEKEEPPKAVKSSEVGMPESPQADIVITLEDVMVLIEENPQLRVPLEHITMRRMLNDIQSGQKKEDFRN